MTETELRLKVCETARSWLGTVERTSAHKKLVGLYNAIKPLPVGYTLKETDSWCAAFVSVVAKQCDLLDILYPECSCPRMLSIYKQKGRWIEDDGYVPAPGDLVMYGWSDSGNGDYAGPPDHVGIVCSVLDDKSITVIEGNYQDSVKTRVIRVDARYIRGYCVPDYASKASFGIDLGALIQQITPEQAYALIEKAQQYAAGLILPESMRPEFTEAIQAGVTDGSRPMALATRWQVALMAYRAGKQL